MIPSQRPDPPFESGAQRTVERRAEMPRPGGGLAQAVIIAVSVMVVVAAVLWILVPFGG